MSGFPFPVWNNDPPKPPCKEHRVFLQIGEGVYVCVACNNVYSVTLAPKK
jgi:hypothetical protein